jgi:hypothetical protein
VWWQALPQQSGHALLRHVHEHYTYLVAANIGFYRRGVEALWVKRTSSCSGRPSGAAVRASIAKGAIRNERWRHCKAALMRMEA